MTNEEFIKEVKRYYSDNFNYISSEEPTLSLLTNIARYFAQWGAEHSGSSETPNDIEEAARKYKEGVPVDTIIYYCGTDEDVYFSNRIVDAFIAGAKWQAERLLSGRPLPEDTVLFNKGVEEGKRLMRDEAVGAKFVSMDEGVIKYSPLFTRKLKQIFRPSDKVRIIVLPNTDEK